MKSRKRKSTSRLTAFLLFLSMLLSTVAVFPSSVLAVESEGESIDESQELPLEEDLALQDPIDVGFETEFEGFDENTVSTALSLSNPVYDDGASTTIRPNGNNVDLSVGDTLIVRIQSTVTNFKSIEVSIDNTSVMSYSIVKY